MTQGGGYQFPDFESPHSSGSGPRDLNSDFEDDPYRIHGDDGSQGYSDPYAVPGPASNSFPVSPPSSSAFPAAQAQPQPTGQAQPVYALAPPTSSHAVVGLVLGIAALTVCSGLTAPIGLVFSLLGMRETGQNAVQPKGGRGLAIAGLVTSILGSLILLLIVAYIVLVIGVVALDSSS